MGQATTDRLLQLIHERVPGGHAAPIDAEALAARLGRSVTEVNGRLSACQVDDLVRLRRTPDGENLIVEALTPTGLKRVRQAG